MSREELVAQARAALGPVGAFVGTTPQSRASAVVERDGVRRLESGGWRALWTNEVVGTDALIRAALWLAATEHTVVGTCIANAWARPPQTAHAAATQLAQAYPQRFVFGLGVGVSEQAAQVGQTFRSAVVTAETYLREMPEADYPRVLAANGPRMLARAGALTDGALPAGRPPTATAAAREALGPDKLLVVYVPFTATDPAATVARDVAEHVAAGADHVIVGMSYATEFGVAVARLDELAPELARGG